MNLKFGKMLGGIAGSLHLYNFFSKIGIEGVFYRKCYKERLQLSDKYYYNNEIRIVKNAEMFFDEHSKLVYKKAIKYRRTHYLCDRAPYCKEKEYFNSLTPLKEDEVLVDCGGFTGDSVLEFLNFNNKQYKQIVSFEPDAINYCKEKIALANVENCIVLNCGVWNKDTQLRFEENNTAGSRVDDAVDKGVLINVVAIDNVAECKNASFIKMDIEGSELMALKGAYETIISNRPILAVCLYHSDEDMLSIPEWMNSNLKDYRFYCRHHSYYQEETIMYAIPNERYQ